MKIQIDKARCIAAGQCVLQAPKVFDQNEEDGIVILLNDNPTEDLWESTRMAARLCPSEAITIIED